MVFITCKNGGLKMMTGHYKRNFGVECFDIETRKPIIVYAYNIPYRTGLQKRLARINANLKYLK